mmetsp:Transcript_40675/g.107505  ORF Transcript_40675/g.107505 Transcript_40675/m.107505 type:complete len:251 (+) Transcript_40675:347-1099(+)
MRRSPRRRRRPRRHATLWGGPWCRRARPRRRRARRERALAGAADATIGFGPCPRRLRGESGCVHARRRGGRLAAAQLRHEARVLVVHRRRAPAPARRWRRATRVEQRALGRGVPPVGRVDARLLLLERAVDDGELAHLLLLLLHRIVAVRVEHLLDHRLAPLDALLVGPLDEHVHGLVVLGPEGFAVVSPHAVLDGTFPANHDLAARLALHPLLGVAARADERAEKVVARVLVDRHHDLTPLALRRLGLE